MARKGAVLKLNKTLMKGHIWPEVDAVTDKFAEEVVQDAKSNHEWKDVTGATTAAISWDRKKNVTAFKVAKGKGVWFELGWMLKPYGKGKPRLVRKAGLTAAFDAMKGDLNRRLKDIV